ncbi:hypothetical protein H8R20_04900 [Morganella morganii]|uniref:hypothetical protein n=1 Tax=Morganella morganii TaxID=582 RepID=UPI001647BA3E|nr:hypothetical protein [Morganella morganii]MBC3994931.1 hypothetical protein [Morganella morganii]
MIKHRLSSVLALFLLLPASAAYAEKTQDNLYASCRQLNEGEVYDGLNTYRCFFIKQNIRGVYSRYRNDFYQPDDLKKSLPAKDMTYQTTDAEIRYRWLSPGKLEMTVTHRVAIEEYRYLFTEKPDGTVLDIEVETGY